ncbi:MAG: hypothetical protein RR556_10965 [Cetobacterium sp.]
MDYNNLVLEKSLRIVYFNVKSALEITKEEDVEKYYRLIFLIIKRRLRTGKKTRTNYIKKKIEIQRETLSKEDMLALKYLEDNLDFLHKVVEILVEEKCNSNWLNRLKEEWKE